MKLTLTVNEQKHQVEADPTMPILWVLRDLLKKTGTKFSCGRGLCGACTILMDQKAIRSCITPVSAAVDKKLTTIEGLSSKGDHPLQRAWHDKNVPQCGYCQPGQIMNAAGLLHEIPHPTSQQVREHMAGNLCRCGTYQRIEQAILLASQKQEKPSSQPVKQKTPSSKPTKGGL